MVLVRVEVGDQKINIGKSDVVHVVISKKVRCKNLINKKALCLTCVIEDMHF